MPASEYQPLLDGEIETIARPSRIPLITTLVLMLPPLPASLLYFKASRHFAEDLDIHDPAFLNFLGISCMIAELALFEVKTVKFGKLLGEEIERISRLDNRDDRIEYYRQHGAN